MEIASVIKAPEGVSILRNGQTMQLQVGDKLMWGDQISNNGSQQIEISMPNQAANQSDTVLKMEAGSIARLDKVPSPTGGDEFRTEVVAMTDGVEIYDVDTASDTVSALVGGTTGGLSGAGLLAAGGAAALVAGLASGGGGGSSDPGTNFTPAEAPSPTITPTAGPSSAPTDAPTGTPSGAPTGAPTGSPTGAPTGSPTGAPTGAPTGGPTDAPSGAPSDTPTDAPASSGVVGAIDEVEQMANDNGGEPLTSNVTTPVNAGLAEGASSLNGASDDPVTSGVAAVVGLPDENYDPTQYDGLAGAVDSLDKGIDASVAGTPAEPLSGATSTVLEGASEGLAGGGGDAPAIPTEPPSELSAITDPVSGVTDQLAALAPAPSSDDAGSPGLDTLTEALGGLQPADSEMPTQESITQQLTAAGEALQASGASTLQDAMSTQASESDPTLPQASSPSTPLDAAVSRAQSMIEPRVDGYSEAVGNHFAVKAVETNADELLATTDAPSPISGVAGNEDSGLPITPPSSNS